MLFGYIDYTHSLRYYLLYFISDADFLRYLR